MLVLAAGFYYSKKFVGIWMPMKGLVQRRKMLVSESSAFGVAFGVCIAHLGGKNSITYS
jgi:hypothetical protein